MAKLLLFSLRCTCHAMHLLHAHCNIAGCWLVVVPNCHKLLQEADVEQHGWRCCSPVFVGLLIPPGRSRLSSCLLRGCFYLPCPGLLWLLASGEACMQLLATSHFSNTGRPQGAGSHVTRLHEQLASRRVVLSSCMGIIIKPACDFLC